MAHVNTVLGPIDSGDLGRTLMHEHLVIGYPGWEADTAFVNPKRADLVARCVDRIAELQDLGYRSMIDPCPNDLGRDVDLMVEVAQRTGFTIICATGLYKEEEGGTPYWKALQHQGGIVGPATELFTTELEAGIGTTGVKAGIIKVATGPHVMSAYEGSVFDAAAAAAVATGAPIMTHTDQGTVGDIQQTRLLDGGVAPHRVIIGHSCGTNDHAYHRTIADRGSYLGFDRFGIPLNPDEDRVRSIKRLIDIGAGDRIVVSHDTVWCWRGRSIVPPDVYDRPDAVWHPTHFERRIIPMLRDAGVSDQAIDALVIDNPRRFFDAQPLPGLGDRDSADIQAPSSTI